MCPSISIAEQLYTEFCTFLGKKYVGQFFDGKKQPNKQFVIGVAASLAKIEDGSEFYEELSQSQVFIVDESHLVAAKTLADVSVGLCGRASYRFFFSGTQMRSDGLDILLQAITGPIVYRFTVKEGVDRGFLAKPIFRMFQLRSSVKYNSDDANDLTRAHVYYNPEVNALAADLINRGVSLTGRPTLVLIDELEQFSQLAPLLRYEVGFAHGGVNKTNKDKVPLQYHKSDPKALVQDFNDGKFPILIGTSCISTGTDIRSVKQCIYLRGGKSEVEVKQSVGRTTRLVPGKEDCVFIDFAIENVPTLKKHAEARRKIYDDIYPSFKLIQQ
jgi:superfamily II DNA or RNA helicase